MVNKDFQILKISEQSKLSCFILLFPNFLLGHPSKKLGPP